MDWNILYPPITKSNMDVKERTLKRGVLQFDVTPEVMTVGYIGKSENEKLDNDWNGGVLDNPRDISNDGSINMTILDRRTWKKGWRPSIKTAFIFIRIQHMRRLHNSWLGTSSIALKTTSLQYKYVNMRSNIFMIIPAQRMINMQMCEILWDHPGWRLIEWDQHLEDGGNVF